MSELKLVSPLLDHLELVQSLQSGGGIATYLLRHVNTGQSYILKHIAVPESKTQVEALLFTGAASNEEEAQRYYEQLVEDYLDELTAMQGLHGSANVATYIDWQVSAREEEIGFDLYLLSDKWQTLPEYLSLTAMTHLRALNLGLDLCTALCDLRAHNLIHRNIKPSNIYLNGLSSFMLGDLGVARIENLKYCAMPERMITEYTAPELSDIMTPFNTTIDIYAVGMVLYRILNGNHGPFEDEKTSSKAANKMRLSGTPLPAPLYADYELAEILFKACAFEPADRYQSPEELMQELVLYMKRNRVSDALIVPPIITDPSEVVSPENMDEEIEPVRFADLDALDSDFVSNFAPDTSNMSAVVEAVRQEEAASVPPPVAETVEKSPAFAAPPAGFEPDDDEELPPGFAPITAHPPADVPVAKPKQKKLLIPIVIAVVLVAVIGVSIYFLGFGGPSINISAINLDTKGTDYLTVSLEGSRISSVQVQCTDAYGNQQTLDWAETPLTFDKLTAGTQYTITVLSKSGRKVTGVASTMASTTPVTEIVNFTATSTMAGQVDLNLYTSGPAPESWTVKYYASGIAEKTATFTGHSTSIAGLEPNVLYTFELIQPEGIVLSGQSKLEFTSSPEVVIADLQIAELSKTSVTVTWSAGEYPPDSWSVTCVGTDGTTKTQTVQSPEAAFAELSTGETYTITVTSVGTVTPATITVSPTAATIGGFTATAKNASTIHVTWTSEAATDDWQLVYTIKNSPIVGKVAVTGTEATLANLIPGTTYTVELQSAAGEKLSGTASAEVRLASAGKFGSYGATRFFMGMFLRPNKTNWTGKDLATGTTEFTAAQRVAFAVESLTGRNASSDAVQVTTVVRDEKNIPIQYETRATKWDAMWVGDLFTGELEKTPSAGTYKLELYFNSQLVATKAFTVN